jgi:hypothetical protein
MVSLLSDLVAPVLSVVALLSDLVAASRWPDRGFPKPQTLSPGLWPSHPYCSNPVPWDASADRVEHRIRARQCLFWHLSR